MKGKKRIYYSIFALFLALYLCIIIVSFSNLNTISKVNNGYISDINIVIDAGHGGEDGGAVANGIIEKDINLSIANKLTDIFIASGYNVTNTRTTDVMINSGGETLRERKVSDMKNRSSIYNSSVSNVVISIHQNMFSQSQYKGTQIFYSANNADSKFLAESVKNSVITCLQPDNLREVKEGNSDIFLLKNATVPAIIVECGFISNSEEAEKLKSEAYQNKLAFCIFNGFMEYYNNRG